MANTFRSKNLWWKMFVSIMLAFMLSLTLFVTACGDKTDDTDDTTETTEEEEGTLPEDTQILKNGNFEIVSDTATYPITSITNWQSNFGITTNIGSTNPSSTYTSGIIDTSKIDDITFTGTNAEEQLEELKKLSVNTHFTTEEIEENGTNLLMLVNNYAGDTGIGTAQKATSSTTLTIASGTAIKVSVWVRTNGFFNSEDETDKSLKCHYVDPNAEAGAYIGLINTVNSTTVAPFYIENIDTNGEWQQYTMLIQGSDYTSSKVKLVVGLGYGNATDVAGYTEGYAFFDDITYEVIPSTSVATDSTLIPYNHTSYASLTEYDIFDDLNNEEVENSTERIFADAKNDLVDIGTNNFAVKFNFALGIIESNLFDDSTYVLPNAIELSSDTLTAPYYPENDGLSGIFSKDILAANTDYTDFMANYPFTSSNILMLRAKTPSAYSVKINNAGNDYELNADKYGILSFWVKTSEIDFGTGAGITITDKGQKNIPESSYAETSFSSIDTTTIETDPDYYDGWTKYSFYISNGSTIDSTRFFDFELSFGLTTQSSEELSYNSGYAAFTNFVYEDVSKTIYDAVTDGTYIKKVILNAGYTANKTSELETVSPGDSLTTTGDNKIETLPVAPSNYYGVTGGTSLTGTTNIEGEYIYPENLINNNVTTGLINYKYISAYTGLGITSLGGNSTQPLIIKNNAATSYGYIGKSSKTLAANTINELRVRVKVIGNAKAYVYLTSSLTDDAYKILTLDRPAVGDYTASTKLLYQIVESTETITDNDGWVYVTFFVKTGATAVNYNIELWNGARDGSDNCTGTVLYDSLNLTTTTSYDDLLEVVDTETENENVLKFTQQKTDEDDETEYTEIVIYAKDTANNKMFVDYTNTDVAEVAEEETDVEEEEEDTTTTTTTDPNVWLMASSLVIALALIVTLILVVIKKTKSKLTTRKVKATTRYKGNKKHYNKEDDLNEQDLEDDDSEDSLDATDDSDDNENYEDNTNNDSDNNKK